MYLDFCVWLISLSIKSSQFIHVITNSRISFFLRVNNVPPCVYPAFSLSIFYWSILDLWYYISFRCTTQWFSVFIYRLYSKFTINVDYILCAVKYIHVLIYFMHSIWFLLISYFFPLSFSPSATTSLFSRSVSLFLFCYIPSFVLFLGFHLEVKSYSICLSLTYFTWYLLGPSILLQMAEFHYFYGWIIFLCVHILHFLYPFISVDRC